MTNNKMNGGKSKSEVYSLFIKEKASEASLRRSLTQAGKERDYAYNEMKKSQTTHQLAVAKHEKLQHEMEQKKLTAELIYDAWKRIDADNNVDFGVCENKMDGMNDKVDTVGISMQVVDDGNVSVLLGQNNEKTRDTSLPDGVGIHVHDVVDNDGKNDGLSTMGSVGVNNDGNGHCGTGEFDNEEEVNDALLTQVAKETEVLWATGQMKKLSATSEDDAGSPHKEKGSSALAIISPERKVNEETNKVKAKASAPHLSIGSVDTVKPAAALAKRARKAK